MGAFNISGGCNTPRKRHHEVHCEDSIQTSTKVIVMRLLSILVNSKRAAIAFNKLPWAVGHRCARRTRSGGCQYWQKNIIFPPDSGSHVHWSLRLIAHIVFRACQVRREPFPRTVPSVEVAGPLPANWTGARDVYIYRIWIPVCVAPEYRSWLVLGPSAEVRSIVSVLRR